MLNWNYRNSAAALAGALAAVIASVAGASLAVAEVPRIFTVGKFPVEATAENAVAAKQKALADGQQAAFRSLLRRLVPVTSYGELRQLRNAKAADFLQGFSVGRERNSSTRYIATLDFAFDAASVRNLISRAGLTFIDKQAPETILVTLYRAPAQGATDELSQGRGSTTWADVWDGLDLAGAAAPLKLAAAKQSLDGGVINRLVSGDPAAPITLQTEYQSDRVVVGLLEPDPSTRRINVTLAGTDAVGAFSLKRSYRYAPGDLAYSMELAAVVSLGVLEGRWKATSGSGGAAVSSGPVMPVQLTVDFGSLGEWQQLRQELEGLPGVSDLRVGGLGTRGADVVLRFPGGGAGLAEALANRGQRLEQIGGVWVLR